MNPTALNERESPVLPVFFVILLAYFDWVLHNQIPFAVILGLGGAVVIVMRPSILRATGGDQVLAQFTPWVRPVAATLPVVVYMLWRGQGTSDSGANVLFAVALVLVVSLVWERQINSALAGFLAGRDRLLPKPLRTLLIAVVPILVGFVVVHGSLADLPAMFGGTTNRAVSPANRGGQIFLGTLLSAVVGYLLAAKPAPADARSRGSRALIPGQGLAAWMVPDPSQPPVAQLPAWLPVEIADAHGAWAMVRTADGWTGWVDGRSLVSEGEAR